MAPGAASWRASRRCGFLLNSAWAAPAGCISTAMPRSGATSALWRRTAAPPCSWTCRRAPTGRRSATAGATAPLPIWPRTAGRSWRSTPACGRRVLSAPELYAADLDQGFLIIEDFGDRLYGRMMADGEDVSEPMAAAVMVLAHVAGARLAAPRSRCRTGRTTWCRTTTTRRSRSSCRCCRLVLAAGQGRGHSPRRARGVRCRLGAASCRRRRPDRPRVGAARLSFAQPGLACRAQGLERVGCSTPRTAFSAIRPTTSRRCCRMPASTFRRPSRAACSNAIAPCARPTRPLRPRRLRGGLCRARRPARHQDPRHLRAPVAARRQAPVSAPSARVSRTLEANLAHPVLAPVRQWFDRHLPLSERDAAVQRLLRARHDARCRRGSAGAP
jgi:hypothetical protein